MLITLFGYHYRMLGNCIPGGEGKWHVSRVINPINLEISDGVRTKVVHAIPFNIQYSRNLEMEVQET